MTDHIGQTYAVKISIETADLIERSCYVLTAASAADAERSVRWHLEAHDIDGFRIHSVTRQKPFYKAWSKLTTKIESHDPGDRPVISEKARPFAFGLIGTVSGKSERDCQRRMGQWLIALASGIKAKIPMHSDGQLIIEEKGETDDTNTQSADRSGGANLHGKPISGGAPSLGKR